MLKTAVNKMTIAEKLRMLREKQNWSQETLSKMINLHRSTISRYETGKTIPNEETLLKFAEVYKVGKDFFKDSKEQQEPNTDHAGFIMKEGPADPDMAIIHQLLADHPEMKKALVEFQLLPPKRKAYAIDALNDFIKLLNHKHKGKM
ncbi:helix-turn-helix transcriptional regulator [Neobacillus sp. OS1-32]|uniref:helix-turn-helix domain-containing protein n=1 Tax=Neobacillus sp. OS1-32 TaxID=3070682 RepID=UPI0027E0E745|nr:helix-turn-helix transcriptional regulator [Neobacillus sp. OS1-32]WML29801.1 helix-turn-helix transcriptional regulator [Neobacillus sp. OS1-32]